MFSFNNNNLRNFQSYVLQIGSESSDADDEEDQFCVPMTMRDEGLPKIVFRPRGSRGSRDGHQYVAFLVFFIVSHCYVIILPPLKTNCLPRIPDHHSLDSHSLEFCRGQTSVPLSNLVLRQSFPIYFVIWTIGYFAIWTIVPAFINSLHCVWCAVISSPTNFCAELSVYLL